jgi:hypothetical protein
VIDGGGVSVLLGNGDGTFQSPTVYPIVYGVNNNATVADFNGDGKADLAVIDGGGVSVLLGNGDGTFSAPEHYTAPFSTAYIATADLEGDGRIDLVVISGSYILSTLLGNGDGTFQAAVIYTFFPEGLGGTAVLGDFNGDGRTDLVSGSTIMLGANATQFKFAGQPVNSIAGATIPPISVQAEDTSGNTVWTASSVTLTSTPTGVNATSVASSGLATFNNLVINTTGTYTITASSPRLASSTSNSFTISPSSPAKLAFGTQPSNAAAGVALSPAVTLQVWDQYGNVVTGSSATVTIGSIPSAASATVNAQNGVAAFSSLVFSASGSYVLVASSSGLTSAISNSFTIGAGNTAMVSGQVTVSGMGLNGVTISVTGSQTTSATTNASGSYNIALAASGTYTLTASLAGYSFSAPVTFSNLSSNQTANFTGIVVTNDCVGMFSTATSLVCSAMNQGAFQGNLAISIGAQTTYYGAMTLVGNVPFGDAPGMALFNAGGGGGASVSLDLYNTAANNGIPQAKIKAIDDGNYSDHLTFWTKTPGRPDNGVAEKLRITSRGNVGIGTTNPTLGPLQMGSGAYVSAGGVWINASDRNSKENFAPVMPMSILRKIDALPIREWNYKNEDPSVRHIGPVAQDFYSIFGVGNSSTSISTIDPSGIALAGIQGLDEKSQGRTARIAELKKQLDAKTEELRALQASLTHLESLLEQSKSDANKR